MNWFYRIMRQRRPILLLLLYFIACVAGPVMLSNFAFGPASHGQGAFVIFSMCEIAAILFMIPLIAVNRAGSAIRGTGITQFLPAQRSSGRIAFGLFRYPLLITALLCLIPGLSVLLMRNFLGFVPALSIMRTSFVVLTIGIFALTIGFYASIIFRSALSAAGFALLVIVLISTQPIWFGPVINSIPNSSLLIQSSLLINPFVSVASTVGFDILRTDPFYQICPIGQLRFEYPSYWSSALFNLLVALAIFGLSAIGIRRMVLPSR
jgi:hypothetical protein